MISKDDPTHTQESEKKITEQRNKYENYNWGKFANIKNLKISIERITLYLKILT